MLVLGREEGQYVMIGDDIRIEIVKSVHGKLRLAIDAPKELNIVRGEIWEEEHKNNL